MTPRHALLVGHATSHEVLAGARDLADAGWAIHVATGAGRSLAGASRAVGGEYQVCPPHVDLDAFRRDVDRALVDCGARVVVGCGDPELLALSALRERLSATVPLAEHDVVMAAVDKLTLSSAATEVGLAVPQTRLAADPVITAWRGPAVVKPRLHFDPQAPALHWSATRLTQSRQEMFAAIEDIRASGGDPVVQQPVSGDLIAFSAVRSASGRVLALMQQRATHTWPPRAGVSARAVTVQVDAVLGSRVVDLLDHLGWIGMAQIQFLQPETGPPRLLDLNGRPYGSMPLARAAGLPLLSCWLGPGMGTRRATVSAAPATARIGVAYSRFGSDLHRAVTERQGGLVRDLTSTCRAWWGAAHPVTDRRDVRPLLRLLHLTSHRLASGAVRRLAGRGRAVRSRSLASARLVRGR